jgi:hypothetical protein
VQEPRICFGLLVGGVLMTGAVILWNWMDTWNEPNDDPSDENGIRRGADFMRGIYRVLGPLFFGAALICWFIQWVT